MCFIQRRVQRILDQKTNFILGHDPVQLRHQLFAFNEDLLLDTRAVFFTDIVLDFLHHRHLVTYQAP